MIVNDTYKVIRMMIVSDAPSCGVTYNRHSDGSRGVIYAPKVVNYVPREGTTHDDCHLAFKMFLWYRYMITMIHQLSISTSLKHSVLLLKTFSACAQLFRHPV